MRLCQNSSLKKRVFNGFQGLLTGSQCLTLFQRHSFNNTQIVGTGVQKQQQRILHTVIVTLMLILKVLCRTVPYCTILCRTLHYIITLFIDLFRSDHDLYNNVYFNKFLALPIILSTRLFNIFSTNKLCGNKQY